MNELSNFTKALVVIFASAILSIGVVLIILIKYLPYVIILGSLLKVFGVIQATWWQVAIWPGITWFIAVILLVGGTIWAETKKAL